MDIWMLLLTFTVPLGGVDIIAQHSSWLFATQAACEAARPILEANAWKLAPKGYSTPVTSTVSACMTQRTLSVADVQQYLDAVPLLEKE